MIETSRYSWEGAEEVEGLRELKQSVEQNRKRILAHPIYDELHTIEDLRIFLSYHVFAVWDFMSLLTALQRRFTCVEIPWRPRGDRLARRLVNEIKLVEESDGIGGEYVSHFELYMDAMEDIGADTTTVRAFLSRIEAGADVPEALRDAEVPAAVASFVGTTWDVVQTAPDHVIAAMFALTREDLIPDMFERVVAGSAHEDSLAKFLTYLNRHITVDAEEHTPMAMALLQSLCTDDAHWTECEKGAGRCLDERLNLWTAVHEAIVAERELVAP